MGAEADVAVEAVPPPRAAVLWTGILAGPVAWGTDLMVRYALVHWTCGTQQTIVLKLISIVTLFFVLGGGMVAWRAFRQIPSSVPTDGGRPVDRGRFMAMIGMLSSGLFALVVVAGAIPQWVLDACR